jgi:hypothetical protein
MKVGSEQARKTGYHDLAEPSRTRTLVAVLGECALYQIDGKISLQRE